MNYFHYSPPVKIGEFIMVNRTGHTFSLLPSILFWRPSWCRFSGHFTPRHPVLVRLWYPSYRVAWRVSYWNSHFPRMVHSCFHTMISCFTMWDPPPAVYCQPLSTHQHQTSGIPWLNHVIRCSLKTTLVSIPWLPLFCQ